jgi:hypothetical protein
MSRAGVLAAILRMRLTLDHSLHAMQQACSGMPFEDIPFQSLFLASETMRNARPRLTS